MVGIRKYLLDQRGDGMSNPTSWQDHIDWSKPLNEEDVWQAIADANNLDYSEIADGDLVEWL